MEQFMQEALRLAREAYADGEVPVGCVIVRGGEIVGRGRNRREARHDPTAHAEMLCLREGASRLGDWRLQDCTLYVTLEPCPMCAGAMVMSRLGRCVYGAADPDMGCCGSVYDLPADPALHAQTRWEQDADEEPYRSLLSGGFRSIRPKGGEV